MANVSSWFGTWVSGSGAPPLLAGQQHEWVMWGFDYGDAITVTAHPLHFYSPAALQVENLRVEDSDTGRRLYFTVRNVGPNYPHAYGLAYAFVS